MSYNSILDGYFSNFWLALGLPFALMVLYLLLRKYIRRGKEYTLLERVIVIGVCFILAMTGALINPMYWGYGHPTAIDDIRLVDGKLLVLDHTMSMGSRTSEGTAYSRIHVLDPMSGEKQIRFPVGAEADLIGMHGDSVAVSRYNDVAYFSVQDGHEQAVYDRETLPVSFKELSSGVNSIMWGDGRNIMEITANDGTSWNLYTASGKLKPVDESAPRLPYSPTNAISIHQNEIRIDNEPGAHVLLELSGEGQNQHQRHLYNDRDSLVNARETFLDGELVGLDLRDSCFFVLSYETLKKERFILSCMALDGKSKRWEIRQSQFNADYVYTEPHLPHVASDEEGAWFG